MVGDQFYEDRKSTERGMGINNIAHIFENFGQVVAENENSANPSSLKNSY